MAERPGGTKIDDDAVSEAADLLYAAAPDDFMSLRDDLSTKARDAGEPAAAKRIKALRKPTVAASMVNRLALEDPSIVDEIRDLGDRLRSAQDDLDARMLRDLSAERRALVASLTGRALDLSGRSDPSAAVKDEVTSTFDAAVSDPAIADRLGRLQRSESWSGFGFAASGSPDLTLVRGGKGRSDRPGPAKAPTREKRPAGKSDAPTVPEATRRKLSRALDKARTAFESAEASLADAESAERSEGERVRSLTAQIADMQQQLDVAKRSLDGARREVKSARSRRREARSALDRAERHAAAQS